MVDINVRRNTISLDRLKPAYLDKDPGSIRNTPTTPAPHSYIGVGTGWLGGAIAPPLLKGNGNLKGVAYFFYLPFSI